MEANALAKVIYYHSRMLDSHQTYCLAFRLLALFGHSQSSKLDLEVSGGSSSAVW